MDSASRNAINRKPKPNIDCVQEPSLAGRFFATDAAGEYRRRPWTHPGSAVETAGAEGGTASPYLLSHRKRILDIAGALAILVVLSPLLLAVALVIRLTSPGPVLFRQLRTGIGGRTFTVYKFRSMKMRREASGLVIQASRNDARITPFGHFMRRTSIDELPQMLNVLNGTMSLIGPRPHAVEHDDYYARRLADYPVRFAALPGLSGLAQVNGARGGTPRLEDMERRLAYDMAYIRSASLRADLKILAATVREMLLSTSAY